MEKSSPKIETRIIHDGEPLPRVYGAVSLPVFQSATYEYAESDRMIRYIRLNNTPNHIALHEKLASLEGGEAGLVTASGMGAISATLLSLLSPGDHFLAQKCLYGGTFDFIAKDLAPLGIACDLIDRDDAAGFAEKIRPETKLIYVETMTNPLLQVADLEGIAALAAEKGILSIIDNTFASPVNFRPLERGFDLSIHSCTKYLNGHSDIVAGAVIGKKDLVKTVARKANHLGATLDPHACWLLHRGIKTLALRVGRQNENALAVARFLESHPAVEKVNYPGLESHPRHERAARLFNGFGGMLSFELQGDVAVADRFIRLTKLPILAPSLGGVETLVTRPATTSHFGLTPEERAELGIADRLIRLSVGIEHADDLIADLDQALSGIS